MKNCKFPPLILILTVFSATPAPAQEEPLPLLEKVEMEELPPADDYYVDDAPLNQILELFDQEDYSQQKAFLEQKRRKIITDAGGIALPDTKYAQSITHDYIARYMTAFGKQSLFKILDDGEPYRIYIRQELARRGLPAALEYLPVVESEYKATAKSRSGARGLWQFMENSMSPFLKKTEFYDERLDPWKATDAALSKLQDNYRMFGDWTIAVAAYNCGAGAMRRALRNADTKTFWYLAEHKMLPEETIHYVPKLLAVTEIACHGDEYRVVLPQVSHATRPNDFDYVTTERTISIERLAQEIRLSPDTLRKLNTALLRGETPPYAYRLRLPQGLARSAEEAVARIMDEL